MRFISAAVLILVAGCSVPGHSLTPTDRLLVACSSWASVLETAVVRRKVGLSSEGEIDAVNKARLVLKPACSSKTAALPADFTLDALEQVLLQAIKAQEKSS